jgi:hypothetical protein
MVPPPQRLFSRLKTWLLTVHHHMRESQVETANFLENFLSGEKKLKFKPSDFLGEKVL